MQDQPPQLCTEQTGETEVGGRGGLDGEDCGKEHGKGIFLKPRITASSKQEEGRAKDHLRFLKTI